MIKTVVIAGQEYIIVGNWSEDEKLGYREIGNDHIEVMSLFCGDVQLFKVHIGALQTVLKYRERMISGEDQQPNDPEAARGFQ